MINEPEGDLIALKSYDYFRYGAKNSNTIQIETDVLNPIGFELSPRTEVPIVLLPDISHLVSKVSE